MLRALQFRLPVSPTGSGESPSRKGRERGLISRFHAGWVSGRPTKRHTLAGLATWTVHGEYPATVRRAELHTGTHEFVAGELVSSSPRTRDAFASRMEDGGLRPLANTAAVGGGAPDAGEDDRSGPESLAVGSWPRPQRRPAPAPRPSSDPTVRPGLGRLCLSPSPPTGGRAFFFPHTAPAGPAVGPAGRL